MVGQILQTVVTVAILTQSSLIEQARPLAHARHGSLHLATLKDIESL